MPRDKSLDALRGLAIVLVVAGHAIPAAVVASHGGPGWISIDPTSWVPTATAKDLLFNLIYSFQMPLFAFVSGLVLWPPRDSPLGKWIALRARRLLVPYFAWFLVTYLLIEGSASAGLGGLGAALFGAVVGRGGLWYLYVLFISSVVIESLARTRAGRWLVPASVVALAAVVLALPPVNVLYLGQLVAVYPFVVLGYMVSPFKAKLAEQRRGLLWGAPVVFAVLFYLQYPHWILEMSPIWRIAALVPGGYFLRILAPYACAAAAIAFLFALYQKRSGRVTDAQVWLGRRSLGIYAIHGLVLVLLVRWGLHSALPLFAISLGASAALVALLERVPVLDMVLLGASPRVRPVEHRTSSEDAPAPGE